MLIIFLYLIIFIYTVYNYICCLFGTHFKNLISNIFHIDTFVINVYMYIWVFTNDFNEEGYIIFHKNMIQVLYCEYLILEWKFRMQYIYCVYIIISVALKALRTLSGDSIYIPFPPTIFDGHCMTLSAVVSLVLLGTITEIQNHH